MTAATINDRFLASGWDAPAVDCLAITPAATAQPAQLRGIYVGSTGTVVIITPAGTTVTFSAVPTGMILPVMASYVLTTSTATLMIGLL